MRTSAVSDHGRRGFTLIEMMVVITIIALLAALIAPNLVSFRQTREQRDEQAALLRLPTEVRNAAIKNKTTVSMRVDGSNIVMEKTDPETQNVQTLKTVPIGQYLQVTGAQTAADTSDLASWKWQAYPDGTTDSGGLTFRIGSNKDMGLWMPSDGPAQWLTGELPQPKSDSWTAGDIVQRTATSTSTGAVGAASGGATGGR